MKILSPSQKVQYDSDQDPAREARSSKSPGDITVAELRRKCIINLKQAIKAYLEMHSTRCLASRYWVGTQSTISAAFLLFLQDESRQDSKYTRLLRDPEAVIAECSNMESTFFDTTDSHNICHDQSVTVHPDVEIGVAIALIKMLPIHHNVHVRSHNR